MELPKKPELEILEVCEITPSPSPAAEFSLPLTIFDFVYYKIPPTERLLFYSLPVDDEPHLDSVLQNLKHSLSLTLSHFFPLAGNLVWPNHSQEPFILYKPGDSVSLTVAKTVADFNHLSSDHVRRANESHFLVPKLQTSDTVAPAMCLQITLFPNCGLSIGIITSHVVVDGKMSTMFLKSWAFLCSELGNPPALPPELTPVFDRTFMKDPSGLEQLCVKYLGPYLQDKRLCVGSKVAVSDDVVSGTFELTRADIENLRRKVTETFSSARHLSTFVLTFAHVTTCLVKAKRFEAKGKIALSFLVDWRSRLGPEVGVNYFGNAACGHGVFMEVREFEEENAIAMVSKKLSDAIAELEEKTKANKNGVVEFLDEGFKRWRKEMPILETIVVAGSPRFGVYGINFGWGGCKKVEMTSITPGEGFSMAESKNGNNGVEIGVLLPPDVMNAFCSLFFEGVK